MKQAPHCFTDEVPNNGIQFHNLLIIEEYNISHHHLQNLQFTLTISHKKGKLILKLHTNHLATLNIEAVKHKSTTFIELILKRLLADDFKYL